MLTCVGSWPISPSKPNEQHYDAFIAYSSYDDFKVVKELCQTLENTKPYYRLCISARDFLAGIPIVDNITESMRASRQVIVLLSENFVTSPWCLFEFDVAYALSNANRTSTLLVVLLEDAIPTIPKTAE